MTPDEKRDAVVPWLRQIAARDAEIERLRAELAEQTVLPDGYVVTYATEYANGTIQLTCKPDPEVTP